MKLLIFIILSLFNVSIYSSTSSLHSDKVNSLIEILSARFNKDVGCVMTVTDCEKALVTLSTIIDRKSILKISNIGADSITFSDNLFINTKIVHAQIVVFMPVSSSKNQMLKFLASQPSKNSESIKQIRDKLKRKFELFDEIKNITNIDNNVFCYMILDATTCINGLLKIKEAIRDINIADKTIDSIYLAEEIISKYDLNKARGMVTGDSFAISIPTSYTVSQIKEYIDSLPNKGTSEYYEQIGKKTTSGLKARIKNLEKNYNIEIKTYLCNQNNHVESKALDNLESIFSQGILNEVPVEHLLLSIYSDDLKVRNGKIAIVLDVKLSEEEMLEHFLSQPKTGSGEIQFLKKQHQEKQLLINYFNYNTSFKVDCSVLISSEDCTKGLTLLKKAFLTNKETVSKFQKITIGDTLEKVKFENGVNKIQITNYMTSDELVQYLGKQKLTKLSIFQRLKNLF